MGVAVLGHLVIVGLVVIGEMVGPGLGKKDGLGVCIGGACVVCRIGISFVDYNSV